MWCGDTYLSKITAFLEYILRPLSIDYCKTVVNEYCKDSLNYIKDLMKWKHFEGDDYDKMDCEYRIIASDVKSLYPSITRKLIYNALTDCLSLCKEM